MKDLSATDAARRFSDVLDAVEHRGESFAIVRRGHAVAQLVPVAASQGRDVKRFLLSHRADPAWREDLEDLRGGLVAEERS
ncbi:MAG: type II toxin-antitoxin system prevent-host-death family antitoxin [Actinomycetota bacterium]